MNTNMKDSNNYYGLYDLLYINNNDQANGSVGYHVLTALSPPLVII